MYSYEGVHGKVPQFYLSWAETWGLQQDWKRQHGCELGDNLKATSCSSFFRKLSLH